MFDEISSSHVPAARRDAKKGGSAWRSTEGPAIRGPQNSYSLYIGMGLAASERPISKAYGEAHELAPHLCRGDHQQRQRGRGLARALRPPRRQALPEDLALGPLLHVPLERHGA